LLRARIVHLPFAIWHWLLAMSVAAVPRSVHPRLNLNSAVGIEQQRREDAKKELGDGKFEGGFGFTCQVKVSDFGQMASIALFSAFASS
jgi:hypothetical protein